MRVPPQAGRWARIQAKIDTGYAKAARVLGQPFLLFRPQVGSPPISYAGLIGSVTADFTNAKASGFNYDRSIQNDDAHWHGLFSGEPVELGDYLVSNIDETAYFVTAMPPLKPIGCILCNRTVTHLRPGSQVDEDGGAGEGLPSQEGGAGRYFGTSRDADQDGIGPGEKTLACDVPVALIPLAGAARGQGQVPGDAPGPGRWRMHLPVSVFPLGSVENRDIFTDDGGNRYQVATDGWTEIGYRPELIRLEN